MQHVTSEQAAGLLDRLAAIDPNFCQRFNPGTWMLESGPGGESALHVFAGSPPVDPEPAMSVQSMARVQFLIQRRVAHTQGGLWIELEGSDDGQPFGWECRVTAMNDPTDEETPSGSILHATAHGPAPALCVLCAYVEALEQLPRATKEHILPETEEASR